MRFLFFLALVVASCQPTIGFSQLGPYLSMDEDIIGRYYKPDESYLKYLEELRSLRMEWKHIQSSGPWAKYDGRLKKVKELVFEMDGRTLYTACKVTAQKVILPSSDIRYKSNDQLFCSKNDISKGKINKIATLYNEDGSPLYKETPVIEGKLTEVVSYKNKDELVFKFQYSSRYAGGAERLPNGPVLKRYLYDKEYRSEEMISSIAQESAVLPLADSNRYVGFSHVGTLHTNEYGDLTGYFFPHQRRAGNGTVFYRDFNGRKEWVLVVDGEIEMAVPASTEEEPQLPDLMNNLTNTISLSWLPDPPDGSQKNIFRKVNIGTYQTQNIATHSGYGVNYHSQDSAMAGDKRFLEVGIFKNGQLNGLGYRCRMTSIYDPSSTLHPDPSRGVHTAGVVQEKVYAEAGLFENGKLKKGRVIRIDNDNYLYRNYWTKTKVASSDYILRRNWSFKPYNVIQDLPLAKIPADAKIYIKLLDAVCDVEEVNIASGTILVKYRGQRLELDKDCGPIYQYIFTKNQVAYNCPKTKLVKNYEYRDKTVSHKVTAYDTRTVTGTSGKIMYSQKIENASLDITYKVRQMNGYKTITCPTCNGTGKKYATQNAKLFRPIAFGD